MSQRIDKKERVTDDAPQNLSAIAVLNAWRRLLKTDYARAKDEVDALVARMYALPALHIHDINRYRAQMMNGMAVPSDFILGDHGLLTRA